MAELQNNWLGRMRSNGRENVGNIRNSAAMEQKQQLDRRLASGVSPWTPAQIGIPTRTGQGIGTASPGVSQFAPTQPAQMANTQANTQTNAQTNAQKTNTQLTNPQTNTQRTNTQLTNPQTANTRLTNPQTTKTQLTTPQTTNTQTPSVKINAYTSATYTPKPVKSPVVQAGNAGNAYPQSQNPVDMGYYLTHGIPTTPLIDGPEVARNIGTAVKNTVKSVTDLSRDSKTSIRKKMESVGTQLGGSIVGFMENAAAQNAQNEYEDMRPVALKQLESQKAQLQTVRAPEQRKKLEESIRRTQSWLDEIDRGLASGGHDNTAPLQTARDWLYGVSDKRNQQAEELKEQTLERMPRALRPLMRTMMETSPYLLIGTIPGAGAAAATAAYAYGNTSGNLRRAGYSETAQAAAGLGAAAAVLAGGAVVQALGGQPVKQWLVDRGIQSPLLNAAAQSAIQGAGRATARIAVNETGKELGGFYREQVEMAEQKIQEIQDTAAQEIQNHTMTPEKAAKYEQQIKKNRRIVETGGRDPAALLSGALAEVLLDTAIGMGTYAIQNALTASRNGQADTASAGEIRQTTPEDTVYFRDCTTPEEVSARLHALVRQFHPDAALTNGLDPAEAEEIMKVVNSEYSDIHDWMINSTKELALTISNAYDQVCNGQGLTQEGAVAVTSAMTQLMVITRQNGDEQAIQAVEELMRAVSADFSTIREAASAQQPLALPDATAPTQQPLALPDAAEKSETNRTPVPAPVTRPWNQVKEQWGEEDWREAGWRQAEINQELMAEGSTPLPSYPWYRESGEHWEQRYISQYNDWVTYKKLQNLLGEDAPKTLDEFRKTKYNDPEKFEALDQRAQAAYELREKERARAQEWAKYAPLAEEAELRGVDPNGTIVIGGEKFHADDNGNIHMYRDEQAKQWKLVPDCTYKVHGYIYQTDSLGWKTYADADLKLSNRPRKPINVKIEDMGKDDDRGHIIADIFDGSSHADNLVPQLSKVNRGKYRALEKTFADALKEGKQVHATYRITYRDNTMRPSEIEVTYSIDHSPKKVRLFLN